MEQFLVISINILELINSNSKITPVLMWIFFLRKSLELFEEAKSILVIGIGSDHLLIDLIEDQMNQSRLNISKKTKYFHNEIKKNGK